MQTISFRIDDQKKSRIDKLADLQDRNRSYVINEAIDNYLELMGWQLKHIEEGLAQAECGDFADDEEVRTAFAQWKA